MDTTTVVDLVHLRDTSQRQREIAEAMCAEAKLMIERAARMQIVDTATRSKLARERPHGAVSPPPVDTQLPASAA